jgi:hypothetical protein
MAVAAAPVPNTDLCTSPIDQWIPADTAVVVEVNHAGQWSESFGDNQLGQILLRVTPANRFIRGWRRMQRMLGQTSAQMVDNYFGQSVILLAAHTDPGSPMVIISRLANRELATDLIQKLQLEEREVFEDHHIYQTPDAGAILSLHDTSPTIIFTSERNTAYLKRLILAAKTEPLLKDDKVFNQFLTAIPDNTVLKGYVRPDGDEKHSFFVTNDANAIKAQYIGKMSEMMSVLSQLGSNEPHQFGPLPPDCMAALSVNLNHQQLQDTSVVEMINKIIAPKTFAADLQPKLGKSIVLFLNKPDQMQMLPAVGIALQMKDHDLTADMDTFMKNVMVVSTMSMEKQRSQEPGQAQQPIAPVQPTLVTHNKTAYRTAPVANIKMIQQGMTVITPIQLSWGRINDWYVICSDKQTFCQCVDNPADKQSLIQPVAVAQAPQATTTQIAELQIKPQVLIDHLQRFTQDEPLDEQPMHERRRSYYRPRPISIRDLCTALDKFTQMRINIVRDAQNRMITHLEMDKKPAQ